MELIRRQMRHFRGVKGGSSEAWTYGIFVPLALATRTEALPRVWIPLVSALA